LVVGADRGLLNPSGGIAMDGGEDVVGQKRRRQPPGGSYGYSTSSVGGGDTGSVGSNEGSSQKSKKRFVWPDDLHRWVSGWMRSLFSDEPF